MYMPYFRKIHIYFSKLWPFLQISKMAAMIYKKSIKIWYAYFLIYQRMKKHSWMKYCSHTKSEQYRLTFDRFVSLLWNSRHKNWRKLERDTEIDNLFVNDFYMSNNKKTYSNSSAFTCQISEQFINSMLRYSPLSNFQDCSHGL